MRISNPSVSAILRSFALAPLDGQHVIVWLELAPQHPKVVGAIWASLVNNTSDRLTIRTDDDQYLHVTGLHRRYHRLTMDTPRLAGRARPKFLRLVAPEACTITDRHAPFIALAWPGRTVGHALAAMLEHGTPYPLHIGWGEYLLHAALAGEYATRLITGGPAPQGYVFDKDTPWRDLIAEGVRRGPLTLEGKTTGEWSPQPERIEVDEAIHEEEVELSADDEHALINAAIAQDIASLAHV